MVKKTKTNFTQSIQEVERILLELEKSAEANIAKNIELVEKGLQLIASCRNNLKQVENKVRELKIKFSEKEKPKEEAKDLLFRS